MLALTTNRAVRAPEDNSNMPLTALVLSLLLSLAGIIILVVVKQLRCGSPV